MDFNIQENNFAIKPMRLIRQIIRRCPCFKQTPIVHRNLKTPKFYRGIWCSVVGGLANQLVCYRAGRMLADEHNLPLLGDLSHFQNPGTRPLLIWNFSPNFDLVFEDNQISTILRSQAFDLLGKFTSRNTPHYWETETQEKVRCAYRDTPTAPIFVDLWVGLAFQIAAKEYFRSDRGRTGMNFIESTLNSTELHFRELIKGSKQSVAVHVRRTDFADHDGGLLAPVEQYNTAIEYIENRVGTCNIFVFSDDAPWCKANLRSKGILTVSPVRGEENGHKDLYLASLCRHKILTNESTFSQMIDCISPYHGVDRILVRCSKRTIVPNYSEYQHA